MNPYKHPSPSYALAFQQLYPDTYANYVRYQATSPECGHVAASSHVPHWSKFFIAELQKGNHLFFLTLTYNRYSDSSSNQQTASSKFEAFYFQLIKTIVHPRKFNMPGYRPLQPKVVAVSDIAGSKHKRFIKNHPLRDSQTGIHHHAIASAPDIIADKLYELCNSTPLRTELLSECTFIQSMDFQPIYASNDSIQRVTSYAFSSMRKSNHQVDDAQL